MHQNEVDRKELKRKLNELANFLESNAVQGNVVAFYDSCHLSVCDYLLITLHALASFDHIPNSGEISKLLKIAS